VPAGAIGWIGGFGSKWQSDPARSLRAILLTQRMFDDAKPAPIFETFEQDARKLAEQHLVRILPCTPPQLQALARLARKGKSPSPTEAQSTARHARLLQEEIELP
jgi:CubicO group peptidase (beta-lactamase class C family)